MNPESLKNAWTLVDKPAPWEPPLPSSAAELPQAAADHFHILSSATLIFAKEWDASHLVQFVQRIEATLNAFAPGNVRERIEAAAVAQDAAGHPILTSPAVSVLEMEDRASHAAGMTGVAGAEPIVIEDLVQLAATALRGIADGKDRPEPELDQPLDYDETFALLHPRETEIPVPLDIRTSVDLPRAIDDLESRLTQAKQAQLRQGDRAGLAALAEAGAAALSYLELMTGKKAQALHEEVLESHVYREEIYSQHHRPPHSVARDILYAADRIELARDYAQCRQNVAGDDYMEDRYLVGVIGEFKTIYFSAEEALAAHGKILEPLPQKETLAVHFPSRAEIAARPNVVEALKNFDQPHEQG